MLHAADLGAINPSETSEDCFKDLNKSIVDRKPIIDELAITVSILNTSKKLCQSTFHFVCNQLKDRLRKDQNNKISVLMVDIASAHSVAFARIQINVTNQIYVSELRHQIDAIKARIHKLDELHSGRLKRNATQPGQFETLVVNRLWISNSSFSNVLLKSDQIRLNAPLSTKTLLADQIHVLNRKLVTDRTKRQASPTNVQHLTVKQVNGIEWDDFVASLFLRNRQTTIRGMT